MGGWLVLGCRLVPFRPQAGEPAWAPQALRRQLAVQGSWRKTHAVYDKCWILLRCPECPQGWPLEEVVEAGRRHAVPENDLYGAPAPWMPAA